jgi:hypothetical protein
MLKCNNSDRKRDIPVRKRIPFHSHINIPQPTRLFLHLFSLMHLFDHSVVFLIENEVTGLTI